MQELTSNVRIGKYQVDHKIDTGGLSDVYLLIDPTTQEKAALKVYSEYISTNYKYRIINSVDISMRLSGHKYFPDFYSAGTLGCVAATLENGVVHSLNDPRLLNADYIMMEYIDGINLKEFSEDYWKTRAEASPDVNSSNSSSYISAFLRIMRNSACAYECMHGLNIVHSDVKSANIMLSNLQSQDQKVIILDFDFSFAAKAELIEERFLLLRKSDTPYEDNGTLLFMAPETLYNPEGIRISQYSDIWGIGCTFYRMLCGKLPFEARSEHGLKKEIRHKEPKRLDSIGIDQKISDLVHSCLEKDWRNRPDARQLKQGLEEIMRGKGISYQ